LRTEGREEAAQSAGEVGRTCGHCPAELRTAERRRGPASVPGSHRHRRGRRQKTRLPARRRLRLRRIAADPDELGRAEFVLPALSPALTTFPPSPHQPRAESNGKKTPVG